MPLVAPNYRAPTFNTGASWLDTLLNSIARDPMGGLSPTPMGGVVLNPTASGFQTLLRGAPRVAAALERAPSQFFFHEQPGLGAALAEAVPDLAVPERLIGLTTRITGTNRPIASTIARRGVELGSPKEVPIMIAHDPEVIAQYQAAGYPVSGLRALLHESLHALRAGQQAQREFWAPGNWNVPTSARILQRFGAPALDQGSMTENTVERLAQNIWERLGRP